MAQPWYRNNKLILNDPDKIADQIGRRIRGGLQKQFYNGTGADFIANESLKYALRARMHNDYSGNLTRSYFAQVRINDEEYDYNVRGDGDKDISGEVKSLLPKGMTVEVARRGRRKGEPSKGTTYFKLTSRPARHQPRGKKRRFGGSGKKHFYRTMNKHIERADGSFNPYRVNYSDRLDRIKSKNTVFVLRLGNKAPYTNFLEDKYPVFHPFVASHINRTVRDFTTKQAHIIVQGFVSSANKYGLQAVLRDEKGRFRSREL